MRNAWVNESTRSSVCVVYCVFRSLFLCRVGTKYRSVSSRSPALMSYALWLGICLMFVWALDLSQIVFMSLS